MTGPLSGRTSRLATTPVGQQRGRLGTLAGGDHEPLARGEAPGSRAAVRVLEQVIDGESGPDAAGKLGR
jgi:hypothetical protein